MEWLEASPLPDECKGCAEEDCYNCDYAGKRWYLTKEDELQSVRKGLIRSIERSWRKVLDIDMQMVPFTPEQIMALNNPDQMSLTMFWDCLQVCWDNHNLDAYGDIWGCFYKLISTNFDKDT